MGVLERLARRELLVVTGKGGVGKTAVSAALGMALSRAGRRVLVVEVDPRENLHQMMGVAPSGGDIVPAGPRLWLQNLKPQQVLDEIVREQVKVPFLAERVLQSAIYRQFAAGAPGLKELAILGHALRLRRGQGALGAPELDLVVLDAPATGHGVTLLAAPQLVADVIRQGPFGRMAGELAELVGDPERSGVVVVTQAEEMPVEEALELRAALGERLGRAPELLVVNGLYPPSPAAPAAPAVEDGIGDTPLAALWRRRRELNERELARLTAAWRGAAGAAPGPSPGPSLIPSPILELPQLPMDRGPALTAALAGCLTAAAAAAGREAA
jgi:Mrp family chromosome partitioning ATPase